MGPVNSIEVQVENHMTSTIGAILTYAGNDSWEAINDESVTNLESGYTATMKCKCTGCGSCDLRFCQGGLTGIHDHECEDKEGEGWDEETYNNAGNGKYLHVFEGETSSDITIIKRDYGSREVIYSIENEIPDWDGTAASLEGTSGPNDIQYWDSISTQTLSTGSAFSFSCTALDDENCQLTVTVGNFDPITVEAEHGGCYKVVAYHVEYADGTQGGMQDVQVTERCLGRRLRGPADELN